MTDQEVKEIRIKVENEDYEWNSEELEREDIFGYMVLNVSKKIMGEYLDFRNSSQAKTMGNVVYKNNSQRVKECIIQECIKSKLDLDYVDGKKLQKAILFCMSFPNQTFGDDYNLGLLLGNCINLF